MGCVGGRAELVDMEILVTVNEFSGGCLGTHIVVRASQSQTVEGFANAARARYLSQSVHASHVSWLHGS